MSRPSQLTQDGRTWAQVLRDAVTAGIARRERERAAAAASPTPSQEPATTTTPEHTLQCSCEHCAGFIHQPTASTPSQHPQAATAPAHPWGCTCPPCAVFIHQPAAASTKTSTPPPPAGQDPKLQAPPSTPASSPPPREPIQDEYLRLLSAHTPFVQQHQDEATTLRARAAFHTVPNASGNVGRNLIEAHQNGMPWPPLAPAPRRPAAARGLTPRTRATAHDCGFPWCHGFCDIRGVPAVRAAGHDCGTAYCGGFCANLRG